MESDGGIDTNKLNRVLSKSNIKLEERGWRDNKADNNGDNNADNAGNNNWIDGWINELNLFGKIG